MATKAKPEGTSMAIKLQQIADFGKIGLKHFADFGKTSRKKLRISVK